MELVKFCGWSIWTLLNHQIMTLLSWLFLTFLSSYYLLCRVASVVTLSKCPFATEFEVCLLKFDRGKCFQLWKSPLRRVCYMLHNNLTMLEQGSKIETEIDSAGQPNNWKSLFFLWFYQYVWTFPHDPLWQFLFIQHWSHLFVEVFLYTH